MISSTRSFAVVPCVLVALAALAACSSDASPTSASTSASASSSSSSTSGGGAGGSGGAGGAGGMGCPADAHVDMNGVCASTLSWRTGPSVPRPRNHHMTWLVDAGKDVFLVVAGGIDDASSPVYDVDRARVNADGSLGAWENVGALPVWMSGSGVVLTHGEVILAAGYHTSDTLVAKTKADGSLGAWTMGPKMPGPWFHTAAATLGDWMYVVGGLDGNNESDKVVRAHVAADGTLGAYEAATKLPYVLSHHAIAVAGTTLYVLGGETMDGVPRADVLSSAIAADGTLGAWKKEKPMPLALETHAAAVHDGWLYAVGGIEGGDDASVAKVFRAPIGADGALGAWLEDKASKLPHPRSHVHQLPIWKKYMYSCAGAPTGFPSTTGEVEIGTFE